MTAKTDGTKSTVVAVEKPARYQTPENFQAIATVLALSGIAKNGQDDHGAVEYLVDLMAEMKPRDPIERMLIEQMAVTHARIIKLSLRSGIQQHEIWYRTMSEACDRAANTFRRLVTTFRDYREPRQKNTIMALQANVANQQIVQQQIATSPTVTSPHAVEHIVADKPQVKVERPKGERLLPSPNTVTAADVAKETRRASADRTSRKSRNDNVI